MSTHLDKRPPSDPSSPKGGFGRFNGGGIAHLGGDDGGPDDDRSTPEIAFRVAVYLLVVSLAIMFVAASVVYVFRLPQKASAQFVLPDVVWANTAVLAFSSLTLWWAGRQIRRSNPAGLARGLGVTFVLGALFVVGQFSAWTELHRMGQRPDTGFFSGYFYFITGLHGAHLVSGIIVLAVMFVRSILGRYSVDDHLGIDLGSFYWHFLDILWLGLFGLLLVK